MISYVNNPLHKLLACVAKNLSETALYSLLLASQQHLILFLIKVKRAEQTHTLQFQLSSAI